MDDPALAQALREAVLARHFERTPDRRLGGAPIPALPSLDLAVVGFPHDGQPAFWANVLFSREWPLGLVAEVVLSASTVLAPSKLARMKPAVRARCDGQSVHRVGPYAFVDFDVLRIGWGSAGGADAG